MNNKDVFDLFIPFVGFLGKVLGKNVEVVLHDITNPDASIIAIANGHITNRMLGGRLTDFALEIIEKNKAKEIPFIANYSGVVKGNKSLRSSTFLIKDSNHVLIGLLCINSDDSILKDTLENIQSLLNFPTEHAIDENEQKEIKENFNITMDDMAAESIAEIVHEKGVAVEYLKQEDKLEMIESLQKRGFFMLKGSVTTLSEMMKVSEASIYRYIRSIKK